MAKKVLLGIFIAAFIAGAAVTYLQQPAQTQPTVPAQNLPACGDGLCQPLERQGRTCPEDCLAPPNATRPGGQPPGQRPNMGGSAPPMQTNTTQGETPYYFIAIHNEPNHGTPNGEQRIAQAYPVLKEIIAKADQYNMKITAMLSAQWADYIIKSPERAAEVVSWTANGHEIAAHHHGVYHGSWDGYSGYPEDEADAIRLQQGQSPPEEYLGTLDDYMDELYQVNPSMDSGCLNDEIDKKELPDQIIYDTCSGFANYGTPGTRNGDTVSDKGVNKYVTTGVYNGIKRYWLTHFQVYQDMEGAKSRFNSMGSGVYGVIVHSTADQAQDLYEFMDFMHTRDPNGAKSKTVSQVVTEQLLPEQELPEETIAQIYTQSKPKTGIAAKCGDYICDELEKANPALCPSDCSSVS